MTTRNDNSLSTEVYGEAGIGRCFVSFSLRLIYVNMINLSKYSLCVVSYLTHFTKYY